jgi:hypothetical protein
MTIAIAAPKIPKTIVMISFCPRPFLEFEGDGGVNVGVADVVDDDGLCEAKDC